MTYKWYTHLCKYNILPYAYVHTNLFVWIYIYKHMHLYAYALLCICTIKPNIYLKQQLFYIFLISFFVIFAAYMLIFCVSWRVSLVRPKNIYKFTTDVLFHCKAYDYSCADWVRLCAHLRDVPWEDIFNLSASAAASEFREWVQVGTDVYIPYCKYQVKFHLYPWFSAAIHVFLKKSQFS